MNKKLKINSIIILLIAFVFGCANNTKETFEDPAKLVIPKLPDNYTPTKNASNVKDIATAGTVIKSITPDILPFADLLIQDLMGNEDFSNMFYENSEKYNEEEKINVNICNKQYISASKATTLNAKNVNIFFNETDSADYVTYIEKSSNTEKTIPKTKNKLLKAKLNANVSIDGTQYDIPAVNDDGTNIIKSNSIKSIFAKINLNGNSNSISTRTVDNNKQLSSKGTLKGKVDGYINLSALFDTRDYVGIIHIFVQAKADDLSKTYNYIDTMPENIRILKEETTASGKENSLYNNWLDGIPGSIILKFEITDLKGRNPVIVADISKPSELKRLLNQLK